MLKTINAKGVPPHELTLKVGDICLVTRCLKCNGLATNSRVKILHISNFVIRVQTLQTKNNKTVLIPKIRFKFKPHRGDSFPIMRTQFPLRLAYGITYNKCQGMTLKKTLVDTIHPAFSHGHAFVATSRVRNKDGLKFFCSDYSLHPNGYDTGDMPLMTNVVYTDLLSHIGIGIKNKSTNIQPHPPNQHQINERNILSHDLINYNNSSSPTMVKSKTSNTNPTKVTLNNNVTAVTITSQHRSPLQNLPNNLQKNLSTNNENESQTHSVIIDLSADEENDSQTHSVTAIENHSEDTLRILNLANHANLNIHNFDTVLNYPNPQLLLTTKFNIPITLEKLRCLAVPRWLNDEVINFYMCMLQERDINLCEQNSQRLKSHYFNTFFMDKLLGKYHNRYNTQISKLF